MMLLRRNQMPFAKCRTLIVLSLVSFFTNQPASGDSETAGTEATASSLHARIDAMLEAALPGTPAPPATDAEFLRRLYLDLTGTIPTSDQARAFLDDPSPNKRDLLIDHLLASPEFNRHITTVFDVMWMERRGDKHIKTDEWRAYLSAAFAANKPVNLLAAEILGADGVDDEQRPAARFYLDREGETHLLTRDVGRLFFGMDMQCAQCHDHPLIDDYYQSDYHGMFAFLNRSFIFTDAKAKKSFFAEKGEGGVEFKSVFTGEGGQTGPKLPGDALIAEPEHPKGEEYEVKPEKDVRPVPKFSRRAQLAIHATNGANQAFNRNLANRLWAWMLGRGLVDPVDLHHDANPPTHPELLHLLSDELVAMQFDVRRFLAELARTRAYHRGLDLPENLADQGRAASAALPSLAKQAETLAATREEAVKTAAALVEQKQAAAEATAAAATQAEATLAAAEAAKQAADQAATKLAETQAAVSAKQEVVTLISEAAAKTQAALSKLPNDQTLVAVVQTFQTRSTELTGELQADRTVVEQNAAAAKAMAEQREVAQKAAASASAAVEAARQQQTAINEQLTQAETRRRADQAALATAIAKQQRAEALAKLADLIAAAVESTPDAAATAAADWHEAEAQLADQWAAQSYLAGLRPLAPEQMTMAVLQATGVTDNQRAAVEAELEKTAPLTEADLADVGKLAERERQREQALFDKLKGNFGVFVNLFGNGPGQPPSDFFATVDQALFFANGGQIRSWLNPLGSNLTARLAKIAEPAPLAEELYLAVLTRHPTEAEAADLATYLASRPDDRPAALEELAWALLTSAEFRFGH